MNRRQRKAVVMCGLLLNMVGTGVMFLGEVPTMIGLWAASAATFLIVGLDYRQAVQRAKQVANVDRPGVPRQA